MNEEISWRRLARVVERAGFSPEYYFIEDRASDVPLLWLLHRRRYRAAHAHLCRRWLRASSDT